MRNDPVSGPKRLVERLRSARTAGLLGAGLGIVGLAAAYSGVLWWCVNGYFAGDTLTYWLAATRVLVGHDIYRVLPTDPWLFDIRPYGLFGPPFVVVPWLLLASTPGISGMVVWWVTMAFLGLWSVAAVVIGTRGWAGPIVLTAVPSLTLMIGVGNVDAAVLAGIVSTWLLVAKGRQALAGLLVGLLVSLKLTPAVLLVWLVATRRWRAVSAAAAAVGACGALVIVVFGPSIVGDYAGVVVGGAAGGRTASLLVAAALLGATLFLGRRWERVSFALAVFAIPMGSPVAAGHTWGLIVGSLAPWTSDPRTRHVSPHGTGTNEEPSVSS